MDENRQHQAERVAFRGTNLQMLSMAMSRSCSYMDGWLFLLEWVLRVDWECSLVTWILISLPPEKHKGRF